MAMPTRLKLGCQLAATAAVLFAATPAAQADLRDLHPKYWRNRSVMLNYASFGYFQTMWRPWPAGYPQAPYTAVTDPHGEAPAPNGSSPEARPLPGPKVDLQPPVTPYAQPK